MGDFVEVRGREGLCAIGRTEGQPDWREYQALAMNGGSEHLNGRSQWVRVEFQTLTTNTVFRTDVWTTPRPHECWGWL